MTSVGQKHGPMLRAHLATSAQPQKHALPEGLNRGDSKACCHVKGASWAIRSQTHASLSAPRAMAYCITAGRARHSKTPHSSWQWSTTNNRPLQTKRLPAQTQEAV